MVWSSICEHKENRFGWLNSIFTDLFSEDPYIFCTMSYCTRGLKNFIFHCHMHFSKIKTVIGTFWNVYLKVHLWNNSMGMKIRVKRWQGCAHSNHGSVVWLNFCVNGTLWAPHWYNCLVIKAYHVCLFCIFQSHLFHHSIFVKCICWIWVFSSGQTLFHLESACVVHGWFYVWIARHKVEGNHDLESIFDPSGILLETISIKFSTLIANGICFAIVCAHGLLHVHLARIQVLPRKD